MASAVHVKRLGSGVALLTLDLPDKKVNVLSTELMHDFDQAIDQLCADKSVRGLIIASGKTDNFIAGANIEEIQALQNQPATEVFKASQLGKQAFAKIANLPFNTVAAIHGLCLGGGTEMALACKFRLISSDSKSKMGVPEVLLGFLPGWGGTVRLPRLVGIQQALEMITKGSNLDSQTAWKSGLVDEVVEYESLIKRAEEVALNGNVRRYKKPLRKRLSWLGIRNSLLEGTTLGRKLLFNGATKLVRAKSKGYLAPNEAVKVIQKSFEVPLEEAFRLESEAFARLAVSQVSKNLVQLFFAQTESKRVAENLNLTIKVKKVGVLGAGVMGAGIAQAALYAGYQVVLKDIKQEFLDKGVAAIRALFENMVEKGKLSQAAYEENMSRLKPTLSYADMADCDMVCEAVAEVMYVKRLVRSEVEQVINKPFIFASNTSSLSVAGITEEHVPTNEREKALPAARYPELVVGLHFFNPVHKLPLVEVVRTGKSSEEALAIAKLFALKLPCALPRVTPVVEDKVGFVDNRILGPYLLEAVRMMEQGVPPEDIEKAMLDFGMPVGPLSLLDDVGLDICIHVVHTLHGALGDRMQPPAMLEEFGKLKLLGKKGGKGIYLYGPDGERLRNQKTKRPIFNPDVLALVKAPRSPKTKTEIQDRLVLVMVNEAARCLAEGVVKDPGQLDLAMVFGTGFPPFTGGPLRYADQRGLKALCDKLTDLAQVSTANYQPAPLLVEKAEKRETFYS